MTIAKSLVIIGIAILGMLMILVYPSAASSPGDGSSASCEPPPTTPKPSKGGQR